MSFQLCISRLDSTELAAYIPLIDGRSSDEDSRAAALRHFDSLIAYEREALHRQVANYAFCKLQALEDTADPRSDLEELRHKYQIGAPICSLFFACFSQCT